MERKREKQGYKNLKIVKWKGGDKKQGKRGKRRKERERERKREKDKIRNQRKTKDIEA